MRPETVRQSATQVFCDGFSLSDKVAAMKFHRTDRRLIAWMLYASVLFSLFASSIHHGQMAGLALSGLSGGYCTMEGGGGMGQNAGDADHAGKATAQFSCPLCSSSTTALALNSSAWDLRDIPKGVISPVVVRSWAQPPPRFLWPSLNPRAPPALIPAVTTTV